MNITILTHGSRADVQPFLALANVLQKAGHTVMLAAPHRFVDFAAQYHVPFAPLATTPSLARHIGIPDISIHNNE